MRRYAPLVAIVTVVAIAIGVAVVARGGGSDGEPAATNGSGNTGTGPLMFAEAQREGRADTVEWGPDCDTTVGRVKLPTIYAPPCVEPFSADNGGATAPGVTADTITVAVYQPAADDIASSLIKGAGVDDDPAEVEATRQGLVDVFASVTETSGRKVKLVTVEASGAGSDDAAARADAIRVATDIKPFMALGGPTQSSAYGEELVSRGIVCLGGCSGPVNDSFVRDNAPYVWTTGSGPSGAANGADWLSKRVAGRKAEFAGSPDIREKTRRFALVNYDTPEGDFKESVDAFRAELEQRDVELSANVTYFLDTNKFQESARTMIAKLREAKVTTVIFAGDPLTPIYLTKEATAQGWFPEWIPTGTLLDDTNFFARQYDDQQWNHAFGAVTGPVRVPQEVYDGYAIWEWAYGGPPPATSTAVLIAGAVHQIMTGIHLAGPDLTAESFRDGLFRFPPAGGGPTQPRVSWGYHGSKEADYSPFDDATEIWFDVDATGKDEIGIPGTGLYRWSDGGKRYRPGTWPDTPTSAFREAGSVTEFAERPPEDRAPEYPPPTR
ncbi:MAG: hypothetical protein ACXW1S_06590 [Acidimicrobiia bacterium]